MRSLIEHAPALSGAAGLQAAEVFKDLLSASLNEMLQGTVAPLSEHRALGLYLWQRRLDRCAARLRDLAWAHVSVSAIALAHGFNDLSHFSRVFRRRFGQAPRDYRAGGAGPA